MGDDVPVPTRRDLSRMHSIEVKSDELDEVESLFDAVEPAYALVYRNRGSEGLSAGEASVRIVSCVKAEVEERFTKKIFGQPQDFVAAAACLVDSLGIERSQPLEIPACCVFNDPPSASAARSVIQQNRTLIRHFTPVLDVDADLTILYERQLFKIRSNPRSGVLSEGNSAYRSLYRGRIPPGVASTFAPDVSEAPRRETVPKNEQQERRDGPGHDHVVSRNPVREDTSWVKNGQSLFEGDAAEAKPSVYDVNASGSLTRSRSLHDPSTESQDNKFLYATMPINAAGWQMGADDDQFNQRECRGSQVAAKREEPTRQHSLQEALSCGLMSDQECSYSDRGGSWPQHQDLAIDRADQEQYNYQGKPMVESAKGTNLKQTWQDDDDDGEKRDAKYWDHKHGSPGAQLQKYLNDSRDEARAEQLKLKGQELNSYDGHLDDYGSVQHEKQQEENVEPPPPSHTQHKEHGMEFPTKTYDGDKREPEHSSLQSPLQDQNQKWESDGIVHAPATSPDKTKSKFTMEVDPNDTVGTLKQKIWKSRGYHPNVQRLVFNGAILSDKMRLADCDVTEDSTLVLWLLLGRGRAVRIG